VDVRLTATKLSIPYAIATAKRGYFDSGYMRVSISVRIKRERMIGESTLLLLFEEFPLLCSVWVHGVNGCMV